MRVTAFLIVLLGIQCARAVEINGTAYLPLEAVADRLGMRISWIEKPERLQLVSEWTGIEFTRNTREIRLNGRRIHLGFPVAGKDGTLFLSESDYHNQLQPLLTPQVFGSPPTLSHIWIDPGHGGEDPGAENTDSGLIEKDLTLDLASRLKTLLQEAGFIVSQSRTDDRYIGLEERAQMANDSGADLFLSLHFNALDRNTVSGVETYALTPAAQPSTAAKAVPGTDAQIWPGNRNDPWNALAGFYVQREMVKALNTTDRGLKRARFAVLREIKMPGILIEAGFISHAGERDRIASADYRDRIARSIAEGITVYQRTQKRLSDPGS